MLPLLQALWDSKKRKNLYERQIKKAELEKLKSNIRPVLKEIIEPNMKSCHLEKPVAYGKKADTYSSREGKLNTL